MYVYIYIYTHVYTLVLTRTTCFYTANLRVLLRRRALPEGAAYNYIRIVIPVCICVCMYIRI